MANDFFTYFINNLGLATTTRPDMDTDTFKFALIDHAGADGAPVIATDDFYDDIDGSLVGALSSALASKTFGTVARGVFDAADLTPAFTAVSGATVESINLLKDSGSPATSDLIGFWDTATGLPLTPNGGDVNVTMNASGIFKI